MQSITWAPSHLFRNLVCTASTVLPRLKTDLSKAAQDGIDLHKQSLIDDEFTPIEIQEYKNCLTSIQGELKQELKVSYAGINGVVDAVIVSDTELHIIDLKTGFKPVDPVDNEQLQFYALALRNLYPHRLIYLHIYQRGLKTWQPTETDLNTFNHILLSQITRVENGQIESVTGEHCVNCPSAAFCNTLSKETNRITTYMKDDSYRLNLSDNELNDELINLKDAASLLKKQTNSIRGISRASHEARRAVSELDDESRQSIPRMDR